MESIRIVVTARCGRCALRDGGDRPGWCPDCHGTGRAHHELDIWELRRLLEQETAPIPDVRAADPAPAAALPLVQPEPIP